METRQSIIKVILVAVNRSNLQLFALHTIAQRDEFIQLIVCNNNVIIHVFVTYKLLLCIAYYSFVMNNVTAFYI